jgi:two-component system chemotaxis response regulator CheY
MRILVADDDVSSRLVAQAVVEGLGHVCVTASDGDEAWRLIASFAPEVLVTDRDMPGMDGVTLCRRIRAEQVDGYTYIVLLTALGHPHQVLAGMLAGADDYITKPLNPFHLQTRLLAAARVTALHAALAAARTELAHGAHPPGLPGTTPSHG